MRIGDGIEVVVTVIEQKGIIKIGIRSLRYDSGYREEFY